MPCAGPVYEWTPTWWHWWLVSCWLCFGVCGVVLCHVLLSAVFCGGVSVSPAVTVLVSCRAAQFCVALVRRVCYRVFVLFLLCCVSVSVAVAPGVALCCPVCPVATLRQLLGIMCC